MNKTITATYNKAFKDGDIRGVYPTEIDEHVAYYTARAFVAEYKHTKIIVGHDMRLSTQSLVEAFIRGAREQGSDVVSVGFVTSPMLYFASATLNLPGAMITASHSPRDYNGIKLVESGAIPLTRTNGLATLRARIDDMNLPESKKRGKLSHKNVARAYQRYVLKSFDTKKLSGIKVATDIGNGMAAVLIPLLKEKLPITFETLFEKLDGRFPNRDSDPCLLENQQALIEHIAKKNADFGIGFDGDADRIAFLDEKGRYINCASIGALIAERLIKKQPRAKIVFTNLTSRILEETIKDAGGKPVRARVGHAFLKRKMRDEGAIFGAEHSGHFFFKDFFNTDSVVLTFLHVLEAYSEAKKEGLTFSEMMKPYTVYSQTEDVVIPVANKRLALQKIEKHLKSLKPKRITKFDGYFVDFGNVWGAIKPSVTEYAIKLMFESNTKSKAAKVQKDLLTFVKKIAADTK